MFKVIKIQEKNAKNLLGLKEVLNSEMGRPL